MSEKYSDNQRWADNTYGRWRDEDGRVRRKQFIAANRDLAYGRSENIDRLQDLLFAQATGQAPSIAEAQLRRGLQQALNQQQALAASGRPGYGGLAQRMAAQNSSRLATKNNQQAIEARLAEQQQARSLLQQLLLQARAQEYQAAMGEKNPGGDFWDKAAKFAGPAVTAGGYIFGGGGDKKKEEEATGGGGGGGGGYGYTGAGGDVGQGAGWDSNAGNSNSGYEGDPGQGAGSYDPTQWY